MRELANFATRDTEGIQLPGDLKPTASGTNVAIAPGGVVIKNRQAAGESYIGRNASETLVPIPASGASAQSHLIIMTIKDPAFSPWQPWPVGTPEATILYGPYFYPERFNVSNTATRASQVVSYSAYAVCRVDMPPNTATVQPQFIQDLRNLAQPRIGFASGQMNGPATQDNLLLSETTYRTFPNNAVLGVTVPTWATNLVGDIALNQMQVDKTAADFEARINIGGLVSTPINFDHNGSDWSPVGYVEGKPFTIFADMDVRSLQGQTVTCYPQARRIFTANTGGLWFNSRQQIRFDLRFVERTV